MTLRNAAKLVLAYRDAWRLTDWSITLGWMPASMEDTHHGYIEWSVEDHEACIFLRRRSTDHASTIIHELLHLRLEGTRAKEKEYDPQYEHALNVLAEHLKCYSITK